MSSMKPILETTLISKIEKARSIGEALKITKKFIVSYPAAQQLFPEEYIWNLILSHLGFKLNDWDLPVLHGFFEIKSLKDAPRNTWSYYLIYNTKEGFEFRDSTGKAVLNIEDKSFYMTTNYLFIIGEEDESYDLYYRNLNQPIASIKISSEPEFIDSISETSIGLVFEQYEREEIRHYLLEKEKGVLKSLPLENSDSFIGYGFYGIYHKEEESITMTLFKDQSKEVLNAIPHLSHILGAPAIKTVYRTIESIQDEFNAEPMVIYDSRDKKITWINPYKETIKIFETFAIIKNKVIDIVTGNILYASKSNEKIYLTRNEKGFGYLIWIYNT